MQVDAVYEEEDWKLGGGGNDIDGDDSAVDLFDNENVGVATKSNDADDVDIGGWGGLWKNARDGASSRVASSRFLPSLTRPGWQAGAIMISTGTAGSQTMTTRKVS